MKKLFVFIAISIYLIACGGHEVLIQYKAHCFKISATSISTNLPLQYLGDSIFEWDDLGFKFWFSALEIRPNNKQMGVNSAYATYVTEEYNVESVRIYSDELFNEVKAGDELNEFFEPYAISGNYLPNSLMDALEASVSFFASTNSCDINSGFYGFKLKDAPIHDFSGKLFVEVTLDNGMALTDVTETLYLIP